MRILQPDKGIPTTSMVVISPSRHSPRHLPEGDVVIITTIIGGYDSEDYHHASRQDQRFVPWSSLKTTVRAASIQTIQLLLLAQLNTYNASTAYLLSATVDSRLQPVRANNKHYRSLLQTYWRGYWRGKLPGLTTFAVLVYLTAITKKHLSCEVEQFKTSKVAIQTHQGPYT